MMTTEIWQKTSPITIIFFVLREFKRLLTNFSNFVPILAVVFVGGNKFSDNLPWLIGAGYLVVTMIIAVLHWHFFRFAHDEHAIHVRRGILNKEHLTLKYARIQQAELKQVWFLRPFKRTILAVDSAGAKGQEVEIPGLELPYAQSLRQQMLTERDTSPDTETTITNGTSQQASKTADYEAHLTLSEVVRAGLIDNMAFVILAVIVYPLSQLKVFENYIEPYLEEHASEFADNGLLIGVTAVLTVFALMILLSVVASIVKYYGFSLQVNGQGTTRKFQARSGLFTIRTLSFRYHKLQRVRIRQNLRGVFLKRWVLSIRQLQANRTQKPGAGAQIFGVPAVTAELLADLRAQLKLPAIAADAWHKLSPFALFGKSIWIAIATPILAITAFVQTESIIALAWVASAYAILQTLIVIGWLRFGWAEHNNWLVVRQGIFGRVELWYPVHKLQQVELKQSPLLRLLGYAHVRFYGAAGVQTLPYFPLAKAQALQTHWLHSVASSHKPWL